MHATGGMSCYAHCCVGGAEGGNSSERVQLGRSHTPVRTRGHLIPEFPGCIGGNPVPVMVTSFHVNVKILHVLGMGFSKATSELASLSVTEGIVLTVGAGN
jgi:hypothetical protein